MWNEKNPTWRGNKSHVIDGALNVNEQEVLADFLFFASVLGWLSNFCFASFQLKYIDFNNETCCCCCFCLYIKNSWTCSGVRPWGTKALTLIWVYMGRSYLNMLYRLLCSFTQTEKWKANKTVTLDWMVCWQLPSSCFHSICGSSDAESSPAVMPQYFMLHSATPANSHMATVAQQPCQAPSHNQPCTPSGAWATG